MRPWYYFIYHLTNWIEKIIKRWIACGGVNFEDRREREKKKGGRVESLERIIIRKINNQYNVVYYVIK